MTNHDQDIKQINYGCPGYTVHIPPTLSGCALELGMVYPVVYLSRTTPLRQYNSLLDNKLKVNGKCILCYTLPISKYPLISDVCLTTSECSSLVHTR